MRSPTTANFTGRLEERCFFASCMKCRPGSKPDLRGCFESARCVEDGQATRKLVAVCARVIGALDGLPDDGAVGHVVPELRRRLSATPIQPPPLRERREDISRPRAVAP